MPPQRETVEKGKATHCRILAWRIPMDRGAWQATVYGVTKSRTQLSDRPQSDIDGWCFWGSGGCEKKKNKLLSFMSQHGKEFSERQSGKK